VILGWFTEEYMRDFIKHLFYDTIVGHILIYPAKLIYDICRFHLVPDKIVIKRTFKKRLGYDLNLENPKTFNEKIQWLKLYDRNPLLTLCEDKYAVREYIKEKIGEQFLIPLIYHTDKPADIIPDNMPDFPFIIKTNHYSGEGVIIVKDKSKIDWKSVRKYLAILLKYNYYYRSKEWQYKNIKPRIIVEKLLLNENFGIPFDYKFHCFNGDLAYIQVDLDRHTDQKRNIYDPDWNFLNFQLKCKNGNIVNRPIVLNKMKSLAEIIAKDFCYVRVDFYNLGRKIFFGELTFRPGAGYVAFRPPEWDRKFGDKLILPNLELT